MQSRRFNGYDVALALIFPQISRTTVFPFQYSFGLVDAEWKSPNTQSKELSGNNYSSLSLHAATLVQQWEVLCVV